MPDTMRHVNETNQCGIVQIFQVMLQWHAYAARWQRIALQKRIAAVCLETATVTVTS